GGDGQSVFGRAKSGRGATAEIGAAERAAGEVHPVDAVGGTRGGGKEQRADGNQEHGKDFGSHPLIKACESILRPSRGRTTEPRAQRVSIRSATESTMRE